MKDKILETIKRIIIFILLLYPVAFAIFIALYVGVVLPISGFLWLLPAYLSGKLHMPDIAGSNKVTIISLIISAIVLIIVLKDKKINWKLLKNIVISSALFFVISFSIFSLIALVENAFLNPLINLSSGVRPYLMLIIYFIPDAIAVYAIKYLLFRKNNKKKTGKKRKK